MKARRLRREFIKFIVLLIVLIGTPIIIKTQNPASSTRPNQVDAQEEVLRVDTNLVSIPTIVMDRNGRYISNLTKEDFQIYEDGVKQDVAFFAPVEQPFTVLSLLDVSGSMSYRMEDLTRAANVFARQLRPDDRLMAVAFADFPWTLLKLTRVGELRKEINIRQRRDQHDTMIYDAVDDAFKRMDKIKGKKAIVLFSDGFGTEKFATEKGTLHKAEEQEASIYTVQFSLPDTTPRYTSAKVFYKSTEVAKSYMKDLAQKTGGRYFKVEDISDLSKTFSLVANELRQQYSLGYYPKLPLEKGQIRKIKVKVKDLPNLVVRARDYIKP